MHMSQDQLRSILRYDPEMGAFTWLVQRGSRVRPGSIAGSVQTGGYRQIVINGQAYVAHRLAWFAHYGEWPTRQIDHINGVRDDNRIANLRLATQRQNAINSRRRLPSSTGERNISLLNSGRFRVALFRRHVGVYDTMEKAIAARDAVLETMGLRQYCPDACAQRPTYKPTRPLAGEGLTNITETA